MFASKEGKKVHPMMNKSERGITTLIRILFTSVFLKKMPMPEKVE